MFLQCGCVLFRRKFESFSNRAETQKDWDDFKPIQIRGGVKKLVCDELI